MAVNNMTNRRHAAKRPAEKPVGAREAMSAAVGESHEAFIERLRLLIAESGGARSLARNVDISTNTLQSWLKGSEPSRDKLIRIAKATGVSISWLVAGLGEMRPHRPPQGYKLPGAEPPLVPQPIAFSERYFDFLAELSASKGYPVLKQVIDETMDPTLRKDDLVIVDATPFDNLRPRTGEPAATLPVGIWFLSGVGIRRILEWRLSKDPWKAIAIVTGDNEKYAKEKREIEIDFYRGRPILHRVTWRAGRI